MTVPVFPPGILRVSDLNALASAVRSLVSLATPLSVQKTVNESVTSSTVLQNDDELFLSVAANAVYRVSLFVAYTATGAAAVGGFKFGFTGPSGAVFRWVPNSKIDTDGANAATSIWMISRNIGDTISSGGAGAAEVMAQPTGRLAVGSTSGLFRFQWAQATSNAAATTVLANSFMIAERLS